MLGFGVGALNCQNTVGAEMGPQIRARLGTTAHFCEVVVLKLRTRQGEDLDETGAPPGAVESLMAQHDQSLAWAGDPTTGALEEAFFTQVSPHIP